MINTDYNVLHLTQNPTEFDLEDVSFFTQKRVIDSLEFLIDYSVDLIIIDSTIATSSIVEFLTYLSEDIENLDTPVIVVSQVAKQDLLADLLKEFHIIAILSNELWKVQTQNLLQFLYKQKINTKNIKTTLEITKTKSIKDQLTGAYNRYGCEDIYYKLLTRVEAYQEPFSLLMLDIDHFKRVNDTYGHDIGDEVLVNFCKLITQEVRKNDFLVRLGGEEFALFLSDTTLQAATIVAEKIRKNIENATHSSKELHVTASFGVTHYENDMSLEDLLKSADMLLYQAKAAGRNRVISRPV